jgi:hypothetical protein
MPSTPWQKRLTYVAMSALLAWHTTAIMVAPGPQKAVLAQTLRVPLEPYLKFFMLDNIWQFFAPVINRGTQLRYVIEDSSGKLHTFRPRDELNWLLPDFIWFNQWYQEVLDYPDYYGDTLAKTFCEKHAGLHPVAVTLQQIDQQDFMPSDWLAGKHPLDDGFINITDLGRIKCPS